MLIGLVPGHWMKAADPKPATDDQPLPVRATFRQMSHFAQKVGHFETFAAAPARKHSSRRYLGAALLGH
jgi:hypothetical protein